MIVELIGDISNRRWIELKMHEPKNTLARASYNVKTSSGGIGWKTGTRRTLSVNPNERSFGFPFLVNASVEEPCCGFLVMSITGNVMISRRIRWGEPFVDALPQLVF
jgi:hypothetical protein